MNDRKLSHQQSDIWVMKLANGDMQNITEKLDRQVGQVEWASDSDGLYISYQDHGEVKLSLFELDGDEESLNISLSGQSLGRPYTSGQFAVSDNDEIAYTYSTGTRPADLYLRSKRGKTSAISDLNEDVLGHLTMPEIQPLTVESSVDGKTIEAWMLLPPDFDASKSYPLILEIHGGPHTAYGPNFSAEIQLMAAKGYIVVWSNPRGSTSYGEDFANLIHHNYPSQDYNDLMDVVDGVIAKGNVDTNNLFITGGSGGGVLTAWSIGKTDRFQDTR